MGFYHMVGAGLMRRFQRYDSCLPAKCIGKDSDTQLSADCQYRLWHRQPWPEEAPTAVWLLLQWLPEAAVIDSGLRRGLCCGLCAQHAMLSDALEESFRRQPPGGF